MKKSLLALGVLSLPFCLSAGNSSFTLNKGQVIDTKGHQRPDVLYTAQVSNATLYFFSDHIAYVLSKSEKPSPLDIARGASAEMSTYRFDILFPGSSASVKEGQQLQGYSNYYLAHCPGGITNVPSYKSITYKNLYSNIDLTVTVTGDELKYTLEVNEPADVAANDLKKIRYEGAAVLPSSGTGTILSTPSGTYELPRFETITGAGDQAVISKIATSNTWCTYTGGTDGDESWGTDVDNASLPYVSGYTQSLDLPVGTGTIQTSLAGNYDAYIFKLDNTGNRVWATYYGGTGNDFGYKVKLWGACAVMCGYGSSTDLPMAAGAWQASSAGSYDAFIIRLDANGALYRSTYFGGTGGEFALAMDIDKWGNIIMGGSTSSMSLPLTSTAYQATNAGPLDAYCIKLDSTLTGLWCTFYGGSSSEDVHAISFDNNGNVLFGGGTYSNDLPVSAGAYQTSIVSIPDCYLVKLDSAGNRQWATFFGGMGMEDLNSIAADKWNNVYTTGFTQSIDFPVTANAYQQSLAGNTDAFVTRFGPGGNLAWSTYYGGSMDDKATGIVADTNYYVFVGGYTLSSDLPVNASAYQVTNAGNADAFFVRLDTAGVPGWASYFGGSLDDNANEIAIDPAWDVFLAGSTYSSNLPDTNGVMQPVYGGNGDGFIAKMDGSYGVTVNVPEHRKEEWLAYPNPARDAVWISMKEEGNLSITDVAGRIVKRMALPAGTQKIDISGLSKGVYYLANDDREGRVVKIVKM